ncbi:uncharacterized protein LOC119259833 [Talpa occidentalis]|uniref:uncharacterized protein LOC119259833 n=1 Tax=Talpa occidentalis TaxID=50954 RepID=UPI00188F494A|nr:uncharacterized protein LOC119259833 [Talpa occidentalis]XP_054557559.1 uncharacterized protein LOC119259833 [Talpa occidentalis]XP_054557560.1 uncharacterized protein LOC119259833 [Talpa occidentalis]XP_054557561.1 uncharacterized protein LOC119259833 [Talpa occidentalis]
MQKVIWAEPLPSRMSTQKAELIALTKALTSARGKDLTVYTDGRYTFATAHVHGAIYQERGLLTADGKGIKNTQEILDLLAALWLPRKLAIAHHPGHQKDSSTPTQGNKRADEAARQAALMPIDALTVKLPDPGDPQLPNDPEYSTMDFDYIQSLPGAFPLGDWWYTQETKAILPAHLATDLIQHLHRATHLGEKKIPNLIRQWNLHVRDATCTVRRVVASCQSCAMVNATKTTGEPGMRPQGTRPVFHWEIDFTKQARQEVWPRLRALYEGGGPSQTARRFQPADLVLVRRHKTDGRGLQPLWKGSYIVLLTTPTALKVDGIAAWAHHSHAR